MRILVDTDILIDVALNRMPFADAAVELFDELAGRLGTAFVAWHSISNFFYIVSSEKPCGETLEFLRDLIAFADIAPTGTSALEYALSLDMTDFEDAMQVAAAVSCRADFIITRNISHHRNSPVEAITPQALLKQARWHDTARRR